ncbi:MAG: glycosyltransferase family 4 protein [Frankiaceae bacterium]|nr:glycosyltransferase family 4 protein [Frankiaceae bacterium]MBV9871465.1 glycosyltransferase family 4 protein [Frankiaceae bacterium]
MRIALLHPFSWPEVRRGGERYAHDLAWWLTSQGHDVDFVTVGATDTTEYAAGSRIVKLAPRPTSMADRRGLTGLDGFGRTVLPWLSSHRYDVVHSLATSATVAAVKAKQRVVYSVIGHPGPLRKKIRRPDRKLLDRACHAANVVTALSASAASETTAMTGVPARVVQPGVRLDVFSPNLRARRGRPELLFAADVEDRRKRLSVMLDAMPMVLKSVPQARLVIAGPGVLPDDVDPAVRAAMDTPGVGTFADVSERFRRAHVTVLPSVDEAFGLVLVESLACGTPVVGARSGGLPEIVVPAVGNLAEPDDAASLAVAIIETVALAENPATPAVCATHAARWSWDVVGPQHLDAYDAAIA